MLGFIAAEDRTCLRTRQAEKGRCVGMVQEDVRWIEPARLEELGAPEAGKRKDVGDADGGKGVLPFSDWTEVGG